MDGDGSAAETDTGYAAAFPNPVSGMGCPAACRTGYELVADLDFDTDGDGSADSGDDYWNDFAGWGPVGTQSVPFGATFDGNGHTISSLFIGRGNTEYVGLFGYTGLLSVSVVGGKWVGGLVGINNGMITATYTTGSVTGTGGNVGGLVGYNRDRGGTITASYAAGAVSGAGSNVGGLVGRNIRTITDSYWDTEASGQATSGGGVGKTTSQLQSPTAYTGIYADWNVNIDDADGGDNPWDFGTAAQYPTINYVPSAPTMLSALSGIGQVTLTWATAASIFPITKHQYQRGTITGNAEYDGDWTDIPSSAMGEANYTSYTIHDLEEGQRYTFRVRAWNQSGPGEESRTVELTFTLISRPDRVDRDSMVHEFENLHESGLAVARLTWDSVATDSKPVSGYKIRHQVGEPFPVWTDWIEVNTRSSDLCYSLDQFVPFYNYRFQVAAYNAAGQGRWSGTLHVPPESHFPTPSCVKAALRYEASTSLFSFSGDQIADDCDPPTITGYSISSEPLDRDKYQPGEILEITYTFSEPVTLYPGLKPSVLMAMPGGRYRLAHYDAVRSEESGDQKLVFTWRVEDGFDGGIWIGPDSPSNQYSIGDFDGYAVAPREMEYGRSAQIGKKDSTPQIQWAGFGRGPVVGDRYQTGEVIRVGILWDRPVQVEDPDNPP